MTADTDPIVGHKTLRADDGSIYHEPLRQSEAEAILEKIEANEARVKALMPDEQTAIRMMFDAWYRLKDFGWTEPMYASRDGNSGQVIEIGSTGIHDAVYHGDWPKGSWWICADNDLCPSRPVLFRKKP